MLFGIIEKEKYIMTDEKILVFPSLKNTSIYRKTITPTKHTTDKGPSTE